MAMNAARGGAPRTCRLNTPGGAGVHATSEPVAHEQ